MLSCHGLAVHLWILTSPLPPKLDSQWMKSRTGRKCLSSSPLVDKTPETSCTSNFYVTSTNKIKIRLSKDHHIYTTKPRPRTIQTFHPHPHQRLQILCKGWLFEVQFTIEIRVNHTKGLHTLRVGTGVPNSWYHLRLPHFECLTLCACWQFGILQDIASITHCKQFVLSKRHIRLYSTLDVLLSFPPICKNCTSSRVEFVTSQLFSKLPDSSPAMSSYNFAPSDGRKWS